MRPSTQILLRALLALAAATAVTSCKDRLTEPVDVDPRPRPPVPPPAPAPQSAVLIGAADVATCSSPGTAQTARLIDSMEGIVFTAGDNLADTTASYQRCFAPHWGRHMERLRVTLGNRDYDRDASAADAFDYFGDRAGPRGLGYYSFDAGSWHVVVLNTSGFVDMSAASAQVQWLKADLAAAAARNGAGSNAGPRCTLALFHKRRFYQGAWGRNEAIKPIWDALYAAGVEFVVNGQDKFYERYRPLNPDGVADPVNGIRQFIVGTGGRWLDRFIEPSANVEVRNNTTWGVMKFTLDEGKYSWQFVPAAGGTFSDTGTGTCH
jgi:acid phosphatase type 7